jgi:hypothetical protein
MSGGTRRRFDSSITLAAPMQKLLKKIRAAFEPKKKMRRINFDDSGFCVIENGKTLARVAWFDVREIFAFKEDRFSVDDICLGFRVDDAGTYWTVNEDYLGYKKFLAALENRFTGIRTDWFREVAFPAFARNQTTIWGTKWTPPVKP